MPTPPPALPTHGRPIRTVDHASSKSGARASQSEVDRGPRPDGAAPRPALVDPPL